MTWVHERNKFLKSGKFIHYFSKWHIKLDWLHKRNIEKFNLFLLWTNVMSEIWNLSFLQCQFLQNWHEIFISTSLIRVTQSVKIVLNKSERTILCFLKLCFRSNRFFQNWHENRLSIFSFVERVLSKIDKNLFSLLFWFFDQIDYYKIYKKLIFSIHSL